MLKYICKNVFGFKDTNDANKFFRTFFCVFLFLLKFKSPAQFFFQKFDRLEVKNVQKTFFKQTKYPKYSTSLNTFRKQDLHHRITSSIGLLNT